MRRRHEYKWVGFDVSLFSFSTARGTKKSFDTFPSLFYLRKLRRPRLDGKQKTEKEEQAK